MTQYTKDPAEYPFIQWDGTSLGAASVETFLQNIASDLHFYVLPDGSSGGVWNQGFLYELPDGSKIVGQFEGYVYPNYWVGVGASQKPLVVSDNSGAPDGYTVV